MADAAYSEDESTLASAQAGTELATGNESDTDLLTNIANRKAGPGETLHFAADEPAQPAAAAPTPSGGPAATQGAAPAAQTGTMNIGGQDREITPQHIDDMLRKKAMQEHQVDLDSPPEKQAEERIIKKIPQLFQDTFQRPMQPNEISTIDPKELKKFQAVLKDALKNETNDIKWVQDKYENTRKNYTDFLFKDMKQQMDQLKTLLNVRKEERAEAAPKSEMGKMLIDKYGQDWYNKASSEQKQKAYNDMLQAKETAKGQSLSPEAATNQAKIAIANGGIIQGMGMGSTKARVQVIEAMNALMNAGGLDVSDVVANAAIRKATQSELTRVQNLRGTVSVAMGAADKHGKTILELAQKVDNTGIPALQRWWNAGQKSIAGDKDVNDLNIAIHMYDTETARYLTNMSVGGQLSEREAERFRALLPPYASPDQITGAIQTVGRLMNEKDQSFQSEIDDATSRLKSIGKTGGKEPGAAAGSGQKGFDKKITPATPIQDIATIFTKAGLNKREAYAKAKELKRTSIKQAIKQANPKASDKEIDDYIDKKYTDVRSQ